MSALVDVCVLVAAHRGDHPHHGPALRWLDGVMANGFAWCGHTRNGFLRLVTHPRLFDQPSPVAVALAAWQAWAERPQSRRVLESADADARFDSLCRSHGLAGNDAHDRYLASLALTAGLPVLSFNRGFERIPGLVLQVPG